MVRLIPVGDQWDSWLGRTSCDIYHTHDYHQVAERSGEGKAFLAVYERGDQFLAWPYLLRPIQGFQLALDRSWADVTSVYGYPGPIACNVVKDDPFLREAAEALIDAWREQQVVTLFTRFHPLLENHVWAEPIAGALAAAGVNPTSTTEGIFENGLTVSIDLESDIRDYRLLTRRSIKKGRAAGLTTQHDAQWAFLDEFLRIYYDAMQRNRASESYFFPKAYFEDLRAALGDSAHLVVTKANDRIAAAMTFLEHDGILQAHLGGAASEFLRLSPYQVLLDDVQDWARLRGNRVFHLGGGRSGTNDSLFTFKAGFSKRRHQFFTGRWVVDRSAYNQLCELRNEGLGPGVVENVDFFPAYRAPYLEA